MPDRRRPGAHEDRGHAPDAPGGGLPLRDRLIAYLPRYAPMASRARWLLHLRDRLPGAAALSERALGFSARRSLPRWHSEPFRPRSNGQALAGDGRDVVLFADTFTTWFEPDNAGPRSRCSRPPATGCMRPAAASGGRCAAAAPSLRPGWSRRRDARRARRSPRSAGSSRPACRSSASSRRACSPCATSSRRSCRVRRTAALAGQALLLEEFLWREHGAGRLSLPLRANGPAAGAGARPLPPEGVRRDGRDDRLSRPGARSRGSGDRIELLRHGGRVRLRGRAPCAVTADGGAFAVAGGARRRSPTRSSSRMAPVAGIRSRTAPGAKRCTRRASSRMLWTSARLPRGRKQTGRGAGLSWPPAAALPGAAPAARR